MRVGCMGILHESVLKGVSRGLTLVSTHISNTNHSSRLVSVLLNLVNRGSKISGRNSISIGLIPKE